MEHADPLALQKQELMCGVILVATALWDRQVNGYNCLCCQLMGCGSPHRSRRLRLQAATGS